MSGIRISRNPDLQRLRSEGFEIDVQAGHLVVRNVPYVNSAREVKRGVLVSTLALAGNATTKPDTHVMHFVGEYPCLADGMPIEQIRNDSTRRDLGNGLMIDHTFSAKADYADYYDKVMAYVAILEGQAQVIDSGARANTFSVAVSDGDEGGSQIFNYVDSASTSYEIVSVTAKLELDRIAIVGLGGTGSYVLDLVAKTPVRELHLFDGDILLQKNAFRCPGAPSIEELGAKPYKVNYLREVYSRMRKGVVAHSVFIGTENVSALRDMKFVFVCVDRGSVRRLITSSLEGYDVPFIDVGMGVSVVDGKLGGIVRTTTSTRKRRDHLPKYVSFADRDEQEDYERNVQVADLNALNASLAVIRWKKLFGFYLDLEGEHQSCYTIDGNALVNAERT